MERDRGVDRGGVDAHSSWIFEDSRIRRYSSELIRYHLYGYDEELAVDRHVLKRV
jgi:hypothetical protein